MEMIQNPETATEAAYKKALRPIKTFCTRHKLTFPDSVSPGMTPEERVTCLDRAMPHLCEIAQARQGETHKGPTDKLQQWEMERDYPGYKIRVICEYTPPKWRVIRKGRTEADETLVKGGFPDSDAAYRWLKQACKKGELKPKNINLYLVEQK